MASTLPSTCARPARALFYHLSRRSRAHDRCSVGERGWEGGGRCTLRRELATRRAAVGGGGRPGDREKEGKKEKTTEREGGLPVNVGSPIDSPRATPVHRVRQRRGLTIALARSLWAGWIGRSATMKSALILILVGR